MLLRSFFTTLVLLFSISRDGGAQCLTAKLDPTAFTTRELYQWVTAAQSGRKMATADLFRGRCLYGVAFYLSGFEQGEHEFQTVHWRVVAGGQSVEVTQIMTGTTWPLGVMVARCQAVVNQTPLFYGDVAVGEIWDGDWQTRGVVIDSITVGKQRLRRPGNIDKLCVAK